MATTTALVTASLILSGIAGAQTQLISVSSAGMAANEYSVQNPLDGTGRRVTFMNPATNLVPGDTNNAPDIFLRDTETGTTRRVSVSSSGVQSNGHSRVSSISADGMWVAFDCLATNLDPVATDGRWHAYVHNFATGATVLVDVDPLGFPSDSGGEFPSISANGRWVAFFSRSTNLIPGGTAGFGNVFVRDMQLGVTVLASVNSAGIPGDAASGAFPSISPDGQFVAFASSATNLVAGDTNGFRDVFIRDLAAGQTQRVSLHSNGGQGNGISELGLALPLTNLLSVPQAVSSGGRYVGYSSDASNLMSGDINGKRDAFVFDRVTAVTLRVSVSSTGAQAALGGHSPALSADGRFVAFASASADLVPGDTNNLDDVFCHDTWLGYTTRVSLGNSGGQVGGKVHQISSDGSRVAFGAVQAFIREHTSITPTPIIYCTAKTNSDNCLPAITAQGTPSSSAASGFVLRGTGFRDHLPGALLFGLCGPAATTFYGGTLCIEAPIHFVALGPAGGGSPAGPDCSAGYSIDMNSYASGLLGGNPPPALRSPGTAVYAQFWSRDNGFSRPDNVGHSAGITYIVRS